MMGRLKKPVVRKNRAGHLLDSDRPVRVDFVDAQVILFVNTKCRKFKF